ncbi:twin transmembrane helix small protein [Lacibacterium aquatile]|uniref:Twin transmembrane helix small protein n=1 Tax=Lacibacterium aquatile TaxID=1168082 RepID=A0ABW5DX45_9PROT
MSTFSFICMGVAMLAVLASLFVGLFHMARGAEGSARKSNKMMQARVLFQGVAVVFFILTVLTS